jgi:5'(3')-deoxyribonucleotidase
MKKILYIDLDNTLVNVQSGIDRLTNAEYIRYEKRLDEVPGIFARMEPISGGIDAFHTLAQSFDTYILSMAPWGNASAWQHKLEWVQEHLGADTGGPAYKRLILSHHKHLNRGDFLVDDGSAIGADRFEGELIKFMTPMFPDWNTVTRYLLERADSAPCTERALPSVHRSALQGAAALPR